MKSNPFFSFFKNAPAADQPPASPAPAGPPVAPELANMTRERDNALNEAASLRTQLANANATVTQTTAYANEALGGLAQERDAALNEAASLRAQLAAANGQLAAANTELTGLRAQVQQNRAEIAQQITNEQVATVAASQGVPHGSAAVPPVAGAENPSLNDQIAATKDPMERGRMRAKLWEKN